MAPNIEREEGTVLVLGHYTIIYTVYQPGPVTMPAIVRKKQLQILQMGLGSCYKAALVQTIHCKVQFMQMARTDGTKYLDNEGLQDKMMIEICSPFQFSASDVASAGCRAVHKESQRRPHLWEH